MNALILAAMAAVTTALPSYIAVPADQIAFVDLTSMHVRVPRQTLSPPPLQQLPQALYQQEYQQEYHPITLQQYQQVQQLQQHQQQQQQPIALAPPSEPEPPARIVRIQQQPQDVSGAATLGGTSQYAERPPDFGEYVDFGAHTGDNGAFGWYADYPINNHHESPYRK